MAELKTRTPGEMVAWAEGALFVIGQLKPRVKVGGAMWRDMEVAEAAARLFLETASKRIKAARGK